MSRHPEWMAGWVGSVARAIPQDVRYGRAYRRTRRQLARSQWWSREELEAYQLRKLRETVDYAYHRVPFYKDAFDAAGAHPDQLVSLDDIRRFPRLDKETLKQNIDRIHAPHLDRTRLMPFCTGGTTGSGVWLHFEESFRQREQAFIWHLWNRVGYRHRMRAAILQHRHCPDDINDGIWYEDKIANAMVLSAHRLSPATIGRYLEAIEAYRPQVLIAYPSLAHLLATYAKEAGWRTKVFDLVLCGSETLYDFQRNHLESVLQAKVYIHYGHIESCALFGYCEVSNTYHVMLEYGHVEYLREDGSPADEGETCELVATSFDNLSVPLVRFQTRDWAQRGKGRCACGRANPLVERIEGREGDFVRTPSGKAHSPIVIEFLMDGRKGFADLQIVQDRLDEVMVKVVPAADFDTGELEYFCRLLTDELEHEVTVKSEIVEVIPRTWSQKKSLILSRLPDSGISRGTGAGEERRFGGSRRGPSAEG